MYQALFLKLWIMKVRKKTNREKLNGMENKGKNEEERKTKKTTNKFFCILCQSKMEKGYT